RSVLIYVAEKARAFAEFHRVLRPGGRLSVFEPINRYFGRAHDRLGGFDVSGIEDLAGKVLDVYEAVQPPASDPMLNFGEPDLVELAVDAGFGQVHLDLSIDVRPHRVASTWDSFVGVPPNPLAPSLSEVVAGVLTAEEA